MNFAMWPGAVCVFENAAVDWPGLRWYVGCTLMNFAMLTWEYIGHGAIDDGWRCMITVLW
jgi:hypothetical protein